jgi:hypothetical protein
VEATAGTRPAPRRPRALLAGFVLAALAVALSPPGAAHQLKEALTTVEVNERTGLVEVIHRFWLHDAEHALGSLGGLTGDLRREAPLREAFARYVARQFVLADAERRPLDVQLLGAELEGSFIWVYQEMDAARFEDIAWIGHGSMQEVWSDQLNQVNVKRPSGTRSLYLHAGDGLVAMPPPLPPTS